MESVAKLCVRIVLFIILFANVLLLCYYWKLFKKDIFDGSSVDTDAVTDCPPFLIPCFGYCCPPGITYCNSQRRDCEPIASNRFLNSILAKSFGKGPSYFVEKPMLQKVPTINSERTGIPNDIFDGSSVDTDAVTDCPPFLIPCFGYCCPPGITYCNSQRRDCEPTALNRFLNSILAKSFGKGPSYFVEKPMLQESPTINSERTDISNDIFDGSSVDTDAVTDCPPFLIPCFGYCCPPGITYCNSQRRDCEPIASNRFLNSILAKSFGKGPSYFVEKPMLQESPTINSERTDIPNDISDMSNVNSETITDCPPFLIPCFGACCPPIITYCNSQRRDCEPTASNRLLNLILVRPSGKGPSYSVEEPMLQEVPAINSERTDIPNDVSGTSCLDTETQCARGCCPYSNASCCSETCCRQGAVCLDPLNTCLSIKKDEKSSGNPVMFTEKSVNLRKVNDCPPFMIPCFDTCCPPGITYCNSQRRDCEPQGK